MLRACCYVVRTINFEQSVEIGLKVNILSVECGGILEFKQKFQSSPALSSGRYCTTSPGPEYTDFDPGFREPTNFSSRRPDDSFVLLTQVIVKSIENSLRDPPRY